MSETNMPNNIRYHYAIEKLSQAIRFLAVGEGDVRERLRTAYIGFHTLKDDDFPDDLRKDWQWVMKMLTREKQEMIRGYGTVHASLYKMKNKTGSKIAKTLLQLLDALEFDVRFDKHFRPPFPKYPKRK